MAIVTESYIDRLDKKKKHRSFKTNQGVSIVPTYEYQIVDGVKELVESGVVNIQDKIDSFSVEADINNIISRYINGDLSVLNQVKGTFGDFRNIPDNYAELFNRVQSCQNVFDSLPVEVKEKFGNSYQVFWSSFGTKEFDSIINDFSRSNNVDTVSVDSVPVESVDSIIKE